MRKIISKPEVAVIIPTYNRAKDISRCLDSLVGQDFQNFEVLICDDGSTDDTSSVVAKYTQLLDITYDYSENFGGPARPRNRGIGLARAPYIAFLDSDDWWLPSKLRVSVNTLNAGADVVFHDLYLVTKPDQRIFRKKMHSRVLKSPVFDDLLARGNGLLNSSVVTKKVLLTEIGGVSEESSLIAIEDYDTWVRISKITDKFEFIPFTLGYYWLGGGNISNEDQYIKNICSIKIRYAEDLAVLEQMYSIFWIKYAEGRYHYKRLNYDLAKNSLGLIAFYQSPLLVYMKSQWMLFMIKCKQSKCR